MATKYSTKKLYFHSLVSSLVNLVIVSLYSLLVIRLTLKYLEKDEYGLVSLLAQITTYISILDLGLYVAFSRILVDYRAGTCERYANGLKTASYIFNILGIIGFILTSIIALFGATWFKVPIHLNKEFIILMLVQGISVWATFAIKPFSAPIVSCGKNYLIYWIQSALCIVNAGVFWAALEGGYGIYSSVIANTIQLVIFSFILIKISIPYRNTDNIRGKFSKSTFREVFSFARDSMLWQIGGQTLASLPIFLASIWFTLGTTADISAGMKLILLLVSITTRFADMSVQPLSIEFANGNHNNAAKQMTRITGLSGGIGVSAALFIICVNPLFLGWWMLDKINWSSESNISGALWIAALSINQCMYGFAVIAKQMKLLRWALITECIVYLISAYALKPMLGANSLLCAKPAATIIVGLYIIFLMDRNTGMKLKNIFPGLIRQILTLFIMAPVCLLSSNWIATEIQNKFIAFSTAIAVSFVSIIIIFPIVFSHDLRKDLMNFIYEILNRIVPKKPLS